TTADVGVKASGGGALASISPNPFKPTGRVTVFVPTDGQFRVRIFDANGRLVRTLQEMTTVSRGYREMAMDGSDDHGSPLPSGIYFPKIEPGAGLVTTRVTIVR